MKAPKRISALRPTCCLVAAFLAVVSCGCATNLLLDNAAGGKWQPQAADRVYLFTTKNQTPDVAVFFDQVYFGRYATEPRPVLWCLSQPDGNLVVNTWAIRAFTNSWSSVRSVPLFADASEVPENHTASLPGYAVMGSTNTQFLLHVDGFPAGPYTLPTTGVKGNTPLLLIGAPIALAIDAAIVCTVVYVFFYDAGAFHSSGCH